MGNKVSAVHGVKSDHFYDQGNAVNEIWVGDVEVISRLPFGDSDLEQAGWPPGDFPKIPWHHFIIPMHKRDEASNMTAKFSLWDGSGSYCACHDWLPKHGYLGMYTRIPASAAYMIGFLFLTLAAFLLMYFTYRLAHAFGAWQYLREASRLHPDPAAARRMARDNLWIRLGQAFLVFVLFIFFLVMGLPAFAAGANKMDAASFILYHGFWGGLGAIISGLVISPLGLLWDARKPRPEIRNLS
ncbi:hypothetical protein N7471_012615 [Penicillium samsonianum]|uniref:uncharacterized protein n=1 Tax=Penicillium samsonianum TaxID=1882272 RepID=UPI002549A32F|nr:uncharacterized protein N7471_012615 [Penicillium samsonianum]KAJ6125298.1 hypothetical protein N7471_012615 [Penicillium samsonianum]